MTRKSSHDLDSLELALSRRDDSWLTQTSLSKAAHLQHFSMLSLPQSLLKDLDTFAVGHSAQSIEDGPTNPVSGNYQSQSDPGESSSQGLQPLGQWRLDHVGHKHTSSFSEAEVKRVRGKLSVLEQLTMYTVNASG